MRQTACGDSKGKVTNPRPAGDHGDRHTGSRGSEEAVREIELSAERRYSLPVQGAAVCSRACPRALDTPRMKPSQRLFWLSLAVLASCASSGSSPSGDGANVLVVLHDYKNGQRFELASESHTDRVTYYSEERPDAVRKIQPDEVMSARDRFRCESRSPVARARRCTPTSPRRAGSCARHRGAPRSST